MPPLPPTDLELVLDHTRPLWEEARGQRLYLTGGTGFFGRWLAESFCHANDRLDLKATLTLLTRDAAGFQTREPHCARHPAIRLHHGDILTCDFPEGEFRLVIHAFVDTDPARLPLERFLNNLDGTRRVLEFAASRKTKRFLFCSSGAVYGRQPLDITHVPEEFVSGPDPLRAESCYAEHKHAGEYLCSAFSAAHGFDALIARCFAFSGPLLPMDLGFAIGNFVRDALKGGPLSISGDGTPRRSYLYAADLAVWLWTILFRGAARRAYNVGSGHSVSIAELARTVTEEVCPGADIRIAKQPTPGAAPERYVPSVERARRELGLEERVPLRESIRRMAAWSAARAR